MRIRLESAKQMSRMLNLKLKRTQLIANRSKTKSFNLKENFKISTKKKLSSRRNKSRSKQDLRKIPKRMVILFM